MALLYLVSRRMVHSLAALATVVIGVWWLGRDWEPALVDDPMMIPRNQTLAVHMAAALLASVVGLATWTPFGESERVSPVILPVMRAAHLLLLVAVGVLAVSVVISSWVDVIPGVSLVQVFARNTLFLTGCVLLVGRVIDVRLAWLVPVVLCGVTVVGLLQHMARTGLIEDLWGGSSWNVLAQDQSNGLANAVCLGVAIGAFAGYIRNGVRDSDDAE